jgi:hypothetical protein
MNFERNQQNLPVLEAEASLNTQWPHQALKLYPPYNAKMSKKMEAKMHMKSSTLKLLDFSQIPSNFLEISNNFNLRKLRDDSINIMVKNLE